jgi:hypothetical protein
MRRLNGWHRLGIVLSVAWALSAGPLELMQARDEAISFGMDRYEKCMESAMNPSPSLPPPPNWVDGRR